MHKEAIEASTKVAEQYLQQKEKFITTADRIRNYGPEHLVTTARGSSDHAASFLNFLTMQHLGILSTSLPMSLVTLYQAPLRAHKTLCVGVSQSGASPDVRSPIKYFKEHGGLTLSLVNVENSPLYNESELALGLMAGEEKAVAATKSFITSLSAIYSLVAHWKNDPALIQEISQLPELLERAQKLSWAPFIDKLIHTDKIMVVGRGPGLSLALEAGLKFKETCQIQAEAFSSAEIKHGPQALIDKGYTILIFATSGPIMTDLLRLAEDYKARGANVILAAPSYVKEKDLEIISTKNSELEILTAIQSFYLAISELSIARGLNPDAPKFLNKVTTTL